MIPYENFLFPCKYWAIPFYLSNSGYRFDRLTHLRHTVVAAMARNKGHSLSLKMRMAQPARLITKIQSKLSVPLMPHDPVPGQPLH